MQTKLPHLRASVLIVALGLLAITLPGFGAPLTSTTAAHLKPDESSPVITLLNAGTAPTVATDAASATPSGWLAVELPGPFEAYVPNKEIQKSLDVRPGASIFLSPKADAPAITTMEEGDKAEVTGLLGKWTQIRLEKRMVGYVRLANVAGHAPAAASTPASNRNASTPMSPAPMAASAYGTSSAGQAAPQVALNQSAGASLPRLLAGKFVSTRKPLRPRRPYDWALEDDAGKRYAYLDISKLLLTEQIESYVDHAVVVFGSAKSIPDSKDFVIEVESLQLK
jgi:hypothetical protein